MGGTPERKRDRPWIMRTYAGHSSPAESNALYRRNLARLYRLLQLEPPANLATPICAGSETATGGSMRRVTASQS